MATDRSGSIAADTNLGLGRVAVTTDDTAFPSSADQAGSVPVPPSARGGTTHVLVTARGSGTGVACRVTLFGYEGGVQGRWYVLTRLNSGSTITRTTNTAVADGNNIRYAESSSHISAFTRLYALIDATASIDTGGIDIAFAFEGS